MAVIGHEEQVHGKTKSDDAQKALQDNASAGSVMKEISQPRPASTSDSKNCDGLSVKSRNRDKHHQKNRECAVKRPAAGTSPDRSVSRKKTKLSSQTSSSGGGKSDGQNYATRVTIWADGREFTSRVPCYSGNVVFPAPARHGRKARCPICDKLFVRYDTLRNHVICVHNIIRSGETLYSCIPCKFETSFAYIFTGHKDSHGHRTNLNHYWGVSDSDKTKPQPFIGSSTSSLQPVCWFYSGVHGQSFRPFVGDFIKQKPKVVWYGQTNHLCSSECLSGLNIPPPSPDEVTNRTLRSRKSVDAPADKMQTAAVSVDKESRRLRSSSDACVQKKVTARKSTVQRLTVAFSFTDKKKEASVASKASKTAKTSLPASKASSPEEVITISNSDSDSEEVAAEESSTVTQPPNSNKKQTSSLSLTDKPKDRLSKKSLSCLKVQPSESTGATEKSHRIEASPVSCSASSGSPSVVSISEQNSYKPATSTAIKMPVSVTATQQVHSSSKSVNSPVSTDDTVSAVTSSAALRSVPVIGVAKAVPAVTTVTNATTASNRSLYSLHRFSAETLWSELCRRGGMRSCDCGISFMDSTLYLLHRSCHSDLAPLKCAFCDHKAETCYDFQAHLLDHKK